MITRLVERVASPFAGARVNRDAGTIDGVLICGFASANGNDYPPEIFRRDYHVYEGRPVNCDHGREATVERRFGWLTNVKPDADGKPRGTLNCLKSHPMYERVMEAAERNPALFGFSHVAHCKTRPGKEGRQVVEAIERIESIDLVAEPATTKGLFEGTNMGDQADTSTMDAPTDNSEGEGDLKSALLSALTPLLDEAFETGDPTKAVAALKDFIKLHAKHTGKNTTTDADTDTFDTSGETEARRRRRPTSIGRDRIHPSLTARIGGYRVAEGKPPTDGKAFAEFVG